MTADQTPLLVSRRLTSWSVDQDAEGLPVEVKVRSKGDGLYQCSYTPTSSLKHTVSVAWGGVGVPNSPFRVSSQSQRSAHARSGVTLFRLKNRIKPESTRVVSSESTRRAERVDVFQSVKHESLKENKKPKKPLIIITYTEERFSY